MKNTENIRFACAVVLIASWLACPVVRGQTTPWVHQAVSGPGTTGVFGSLDGIPVDSAGDVNADGFQDVIVGFYNPTATGVNTAAVISGFSGSVLHLFTGPPGYSMFGYDVAGVGDVNGDGYVDVAVVDPAYPPAGACWVYSGLTGGALHIFIGTVLGSHLGWSVDGVGDINGDGAPDILIGAASFPCVNPSWGCIPGIFGRAELRSGLTGALIYQLAGNAPGDEFGRHVEALGRVDGDQVPDFLVQSAGYVRVYSGATGAILQNIGGTSLPVHSTGDIDGDLRGDIAMSGLLGTGGWSPASTFARVYSVALGTVIHHFNGSTFGLTLRGALGVGDWNSDGFNDVVLLAPWGSSPATFAAGSIRIVSGSNGAVLQQMDGNLAGTEFGACAAACGDASGDGVGDLIVRAPYEGGYQGVTYILAAPGSGTPACAAGGLSGGPGNLLGVAVGQGASASYGMPTRRQLVPSGTSALSLRMGAPPAGPASANYVIFGRIGSLLSGTSSTLPFGIGTMCFTPSWLNSGDPSLFVLGDSLGLSPILLPPAALGGTGIPIVGFATLAGLGSFTLQAVVQNPASPALWSVTNALELVF